MSRRLLNILAELETKLEIPIVYSAHLRDDRFQINIYVETFLSGDPKQRTTCSDVPFAIWDPKLGLSGFNYPFVWFRDLLQSPTLETTCREIYEAYLTASTSASSEDEEPEMTQVVNLKNSPYAVYIGRPGQGLDGYFGNPIRKGESCKVCDRVHDTATSTLPCFKKYFNYRLESDPAYKKRVHELKGKVLGCFCKPAPCHGDVIKEYLDGLE